MTAVRAASAAAVALAVALAATGCAPAAPAPSGGLLPGVLIRVVQYRSDMAPHRVQLEVVNDSPDRVVVRSAVLLGSGYAPALRWSDPDVAEIAAGTTVDLPVALTTPSCGATAPLSGRLRLRDGSTRSVRAVDSHGTLADLRRADCFGATAARSASIAFTGFRPLGRRAELDLTLTAAAGSPGPLTVQHVLPTTLLSPADGGELWRVDRRYPASGRLVLRAVPTRCDLHAIAEDKLGTVLPVTLRLPDGEAGTVRAAAPVALKNRILDWIVRACGNAG